VDGDPADAALDLAAVGGAGGGAPASAAAGGDGTEPAIDLPGGAPLPAAASAAHEPPRAAGVRAHSQAVTKVCPYCAFDIPAVASRCGWCTADVTDAQRTAGVVLVDTES
jgi:hypothetical protein